MNEHYDDEALDTGGPTPQYWGFPADPTTRDLHMWDKQERFLAAYAKCGKIGVAAKAIGITRWAVDYWRSTDAYAFKKRLEAAHKDYVEHLESKFEDWMEESKHNVQIGYIFRLKAEDPEKYREEIKVVGVETQIQMLDRLREMATKERQAALEAPAIEAEYRDISMPK
jgi:hypothetical protein